jgi:peptide chain release factor 1
VREGGRRRRVGQVVGGDVDRLHRGDGALLGGGDALLELSDVGAEGRLVADRRRHAAQERRHLRVRLHEAEDVVDEEDDVLPLLVAEVLGHGERREADAGARPGRLVHLAVDEGGARDDRVPVGELRLLHLEVEVVALTRPLADAAEHRHAAVLLGDIVDELQDDDGLAHAGAAEEADLPAPLVGGEEIDHLDPGLEGLHLRLLVGEGRGLAMDGVAFRGRDWPALIDRLADHVHDAAEGRLADRYPDAVARVAHLLAARQAVGRVHGDRAHGLLAQV